MKSLLQRPTAQTVVYVGISVAVAGVTGFLIGSTGTTLAMLLVGGLVILGLLQNKAWFAIAIAATPFISRYGIPLADVVVRPEMIAGAAAAASLFFDRRKSRFTDAQRTIVAMLAGWLFYLTVTTVLHAPSPSGSASVLVWLAIDLALLVWIATNTEYARLIIKFSIGASAVLCGVGIVIWYLAQSGLTTWGVQQDFTYGGYAVYVTVYEANIFASLVVLWSVVAMTKYSRHVSTPLRMFLIFAAPIASVAAHTRAALAAWVLAAAIMIFRKNVAKGVKASLALAGGVSVIFFANVANSSLDGLSKFVNPFDFSGGTGGYRSNSWQVALQDTIGSTGWFAGLGLNTFGQRHVDPTKVSQQEPWYLGNISIQLFHDGGILAVILVGGALILTLLWIRSLDALMIALCYGVVATLTSTLWLAQTWIFAGLAVGLLGHIARERSGISGAEPNSSRNTVRI